MKWTFKNVRPLTVISFNSFAWLCTRIISSMHVIFITKLFMVNFIYFKLIAISRQILEKNLQKLERARKTECLNTFHLSWKVLKLFSNLNSLLSGNITEGTFLS